VSEGKTEQPTAARIRRAREEGDAGESAYVAQAIGVVAAVLLLPATVGAVASRVEALLREAIARASLADTSLSFQGPEVAKEVALLCGPVLACIAAATVAASLVQTGGLRGRRRRGGEDRFLFGQSLASGARVAAALRAIAAGTFVLWILFHELRDHLPDLARMTGRLAYAGPTATRMTRDVAWLVALAGLGLAAVDLVVTRAAWRRRLRMSRDEVRRERREQEGDPFVKQALERTRAEGVARGAIGNLKLATLVVWDGDEAVCALRYEPGDSAPVVIVTGVGVGATAILTRAIELGLPVGENPVGRALADVNAGEPIPEAFYDAVAGVFRDFPSRA